jgi:hypothetical protein
MHLKRTYLVTFVLRYIFKNVAGPNRLIFAIVLTVTFFAVANMSNDFLLDRLSIHAKEQPDKKVFSFIGPGIDGGRIQKSYTYNELAKETSRVAHVLLSSGLAAGDRCVAINTAV